LEIPVGAGGIDVVSLAKERKVDIGRGKSALQQLREHKARLRARPMPGVLTAEDAPNGPTLAQKIQAEGEAAAALRAAAAAAAAATASESAAAAATASESAAAAATASESAAATTPPE